MATFGQLTQGGSNSSTPVNLMRATSFTAPGDLGTVTELHAWLSNPGGSTQDFKAFIYADSAGAPAAQLLVSSAITVAAGAAAADKTFAVSATDLSASAGQTLWLGLMFGTTGSVGRYFFDASGTLKEHDTATYPTPSSPWGGVSQTLVQTMSVYAVYTPAAPRSAGPGMMGVG